MWLPCGHFRTLASVGVFGRAECHTRPMFAGRLRPDFPTLPGEVGQKRLDSRVEEDSLSVFHHDSHVRLLSTEWAVLIVQVCIAIEICHLATKPATL